MTFVSNQTLCLNMCIFNWFFNIIIFVVKQCKVEGGTTVEVDDNIPLKAPSQWKPLLLLIPLRLGLNEINPIYINGLKVIRK